MYNNFFNSNETLRKVFARIILAQTNTYIFVVRYHVSDSLTGQNLNIMMRKLNVFVCL